MYEIKKIFFKKIQRLKDLYWFKITLKGNQFNKSLDRNLKVYLNLNKEERLAYDIDLVKRRNLAHELDLERS